MAKINWTYDEVVTEQDLNDIGKEINAHQAVIEKLDSKLLVYAVAEGTDTYTATILGISSLVEGMSLKVKFTNANTGASSLNINSLGAIPILKGNGSPLTAGNIKAGQIMHLVYDGVNFRPLGEGGEYGTAVAGDVLVGKTIGTEEGIVTGTIPNRSGANTQASSLSSSGNQLRFTPPNGYYNNTSTLYRTDNNWIPENIKQGVNVFGKVGNFAGEGIGAIKSIQHGIIKQNEGIVAIATVNKDNCVAMCYSIALHDTVRYRKYVNSTIEVISNTSIEIAAGEPATAVDVHWVVIEYTNVKRVLKGTSTSYGGTNIPAVNIDKCLTYSSNRTTEYGNTPEGYSYRDFVSFYSSTHILFSPNTGGTHKWYIVEFN